MDWELSSVRIHGWIKKKYVESHIVYMYCTYACACMYAFMYATYVHIHIHIYMHVAHKYTQTHTNTHTLSIRVEKISDTRETRIYTTTQRTPTTNMCLSHSFDAEYVQRVSHVPRLPKEHVLFLFQFFRSLMLHRPNEFFFFFTTRKELVHIVFQQGKTYTIAIFTGPIVIYSFSLREQ